MAALSIVGGPTGPPTAIPEPEHLSDVREAQAYAEQCRERAARARSVLVECVMDARHVHGARLQDIAAALGTTRQYVQKLIREAERGQELERLEAEWLERETRKMEAAQRSGLGFTPADRQCGVCHRFKSAPSAVCDHCGDDPVTYSQGGPDAVDRASYDASYAGGFR